MKQPEDRATLDWVDGETGKTGGGMQGKARMVPVRCRAPGCGFADRLVLQPGQGTPACPRCGREWLAELDPLPAIETGKPGRRGAYAGAVKIGCDNHQARAKTGKSQAEFAALAGVSERTLRTWEAGDKVSTKVRAAIGAVLANLAAPVRAPAHAVRYYDAYTGATWSGRGRMPNWLRHELGKGRRLAEFERTTS